MHHKEQKASRMHESDARTAACAASSSPSDFSPSTSTCALSNSSSWSSSSSSFVLVDDGDVSMTDGVSDLGLVTQEQPEGGIPKARLNTKKTLTIAILVS